MRVFCIGNGESRKGFDLEKLRPHGKIYGCNAIYRDFMPDVLTSVDHGIMHEIYHYCIAQKIPCYFRDWTKVPAMAYEQMLLGGMEETEAKDHLDDVLVTNERNDAKEFVMHGSNLQGIITQIKKDGEKFKKNVKHATIKVSWIHEPEESHSLRDLTPLRGEKTGDSGWACGASSAYVSVLRENPTEIYMIGHDLYSTNNFVNNLYKSTKHYVAKENSPTPAVNWIRQWFRLANEYPKIKFIKVNRYNDGRDHVNGKIKEWENLKNLEYIDYSTLDKRLVL